MSDSNTTVRTAPQASARSPQSRIRGWRAHLFGLIGAVLVGAVLLSAVAPRLLSRASPDAQDLTRRLVPPAWNRRGTLTHVLGTDQLGRDMLARLAYGGRVSLLVGAAAVGVGGPLGLIAGVLSGYYGGTIEAGTMALADVFLATPFLLFAIVTAALIGPGLRNVLIVLVMTGWVVFARVAHGRTLMVKTHEFIDTARALGASDLRILYRHVTPDVFPSFVVISALQIGRMMLAEAALSFLGLGVEASRASWGTMIGVSRDYIWTAPWTVTLPGLAITITVLGINLVGDWLRAQLDPQLKA